ncbi:Endopolyphosphatase [Mortierella alpina]|uniref:Endopolyphosphatase n=1 Tax=Mortierella alpina TaxID=64518 RepID=A0A9P6M644_MORAP|nr:Endopolyphosphatase [Mortierella alpina]
MLNCLWCISPSCTAAAQPDIGYDPEGSRLVGRFLHITDIHPDEHYITDGSIASSCHRNSTDGDDDLKLLRPGRTDGGVGGFFGAPYSICDSPFSLANATFNWIDKNLMGTIDFVVWTGDNARHDSDNMHPRTQKEIEDLNRVIANKFLETFAPDKDDPFQQRIPIVPSIGNNDVYPHNIMEAGPNRILQHFSEIWAEFIPESQYHTFQHGGYYTSEVVPGKITVVSLNTLFFFNQNAAVNGCDDDDEPGTEQMDWLEVELGSLRKRKMTAYLTGHVPPARKSYSPSCFIRYTDIALRFQDVIVGHLYGHANIDHFFILSQSTLTGSNTDDEATDDEDAGKGALTAGQGPSVSAQMILDYKSGGSGESASRTSLLSKRKQTLEDDSQGDEFDPFHQLGLNSYLLELWSQYEDIPKHAKYNDYAMVFVAPSVIPTYNPALRIYSYQLAIEKGRSTETLAEQSEDSGIQENEGSSPVEDDVDDDVSFDGEKKKKKRKHKKPKKPKKPKRPANPPAAPPITFGFPLNYTQYWVNLTQANLEPHKQPEFQVEYRTREDYGMKDLSVPHWLSLARKIVTDTRMRDQYLAWMVVLTGTENDHF